MITIEEITAMNCNHGAPLSEKNPRVWHSLRRFFDDTHGEQ